MDDSIVSPKYLFDHPVYSSHSGLDAVPFPTSRSTNKKQSSRVSGRVAPNTLKFVSPYSKVPVKLTASDQSQRSIQPVSQSRARGYDGANDLLPPPMMLLPDQSQAMMGVNNYDLNPVMMNSSQTQDSFNFSHSSSNHEQNMFRNSSLVMKNDYEVGVKILNFIEEQFYEIILLFCAKIHLPCKVFSLLGRHLLP